MPTADVGLLTVIPAELGAVLSAIGGTIQETDSDGTSYWYGSVDSSVNKRALSVVIGCIGDAGNSTSAAATTRLLNRHRPQMIFLVGIAAGVRDKVRIGDAVFVDRVIAYEPAAIISDGQGGSTKQPRPEHTRISHRLRQNIIHYLSGRCSSERLGETFRKAGGRIPRPTAEQKVNYGKHVVSTVNPPALTTAASGEKLLRDGSILTSMRNSLYGKIEVGEMEAAGFAEACNRAQTGWLVVRGVSDFGDELKDDAFHALAATVAATVTLDFVCYGLELPDKYVSSKRSLDIAPAKRVVHPGTASASVKSTRSTVLWHQVAIGFAVTIGILGVPAGFLLHSYYPPSGEPLVTVSSEPKEGGEVTVAAGPGRIRADEFCVITCNQCPNITRGWIYLRSGNMYDLVVDGASWRFHCLPEGATVIIVVEMSDGHTMVKMKHAAVTVTGTEIRIEAEQFAEGLPPGFSIPKEEDEASSDNIEIEGGGTEGDGEIGKGQDVDQPGIRSKIHVLSPKTRSGIDSAETDVCVRNPEKCTDAHTPPKGESTGDTPTVECILDPGKCRSTPRRGLSSAEIKIAMSKVKSSAKSCGPKYSGRPGEKVTVKVRFSGVTGTVVEATPLAPHGGTALGNCVASALGGAETDKFIGEPVGFQYSVTM